MKCHWIMVILCDWCLLWIYLTTPINSALKLSLVHWMSSTLLPRVIFHCSIVAREHVSVGWKSLKTQRVGTQPARMSPARPLEQVYWTDGGWTRPSTSFHPWVLFIAVSMNFGTSLKLDDSLTVLRETLPDCHRCQNSSTDFASEGAVTSKCPNQASVSPYVPFKPKNNRILYGASSISYAGAGISADAQLFGYAMPHFDLRHQWMQPQVGETAMLRDARATVWRRKLDIFQTIITSLYTRQSILTEYSTSKTKKHETLPSVVSRGSCAWTTLVLSNTPLPECIKTQMTFEDFLVWKMLVHPFVSDYSRQVHDKIQNTHTHTAHT